jgi:hypothetical protein
MNNDDTGAVQCSQDTAFCMPVCERCKDAQSVCRIEDTWQGQITGMHYYCDACGDLVFDEKVAVLEAMKSLGIPPQRDSLG